MKVSFANLLLLLLLLLHTNAVVSDCPAGYDYKYKTCMDPCAAGEFNPMVNGTCLSCPSGMVSSTEGSTSCEFCPLGTTAFSTYGAGSQTYCIVCGEGKFAGALLSHCQECPQGYFNPLQGQASCLQCPLGKWSDSGFSFCHKCDFFKSRLSYTVNGKCDLNFFGMGVDLNFARFTVGCLTALFLVWMVFKLQKKYEFDCIRIYLKKNQNNNIDSSNKPNPYQPMMDELESLANFETVEAWLTFLGLPQYVEKFESEGYNITMINELQKDDLQALGITKLGHQKRILGSLRQLGGRFAGG